MHFLQVRCKHRLSDQSFCDAFLCRIESGIDVVLHLKCKNHKKHISESPMSEYHFDAFGNYTFKAITKAECDSVEHLTVSCGMEIRTHE